MNETTDVKDEIIQAPIEPVAEPDVSSPPDETPTPTVNARSAEATPSNDENQLFEALATLLADKDSQETREMVRDAIFQVDPDGSRVGAILSKRLDETLSKPSEIIHIANSVRISQALAWLKLRPDDILPKLMESLGEKPYFFFEANTAVVAIGQYGPQAEPAIPQLIAQLDAEYVSERQLAAWALGQIGPAAKSAVPKLLEVAGQFKFDHETEAAYPIQAIDRIGIRNEAVQAKMLKLVEQGSQEEANDYITIAAAKVLAETDVPPEKAIPALIAAAEAIEELNWRDDLHAVIFDAMLKLDPTGEHYLPDLLKPIQSGELTDEVEVRQRLIRITEFKQAATAAIEPLKQIALDHLSEDVRGSATYRLGLIGPAAIPALKQLYQEGDSSYAISGLGAMKDAGQPATSFVVGIIRDADVDERIRIQAVTTLGDIQGSTDEGVNTLIELLASDSEDLQEAAIEALEKFGPAAAPSVPALTNLLAQSRDEHTLWGICNALRNIGAAASPAADELAKALSHESESVRDSAQFALRYVPWSSEDAWQRIMSHIEKQTQADGHTPDWGLDILANYSGDPKRVLPLIAKSLDIDKTSIRIDAMKALGRLGGLDAVEILIGLVEAETPFPEYGVAAEALAHVDPPPARTVLPRLSEMVEEVDFKEAGWLAKTMAAIATSDQ